MAMSGLVMSQYQGVMVVGFRNSSILDGATVQAIGQELYKLADEQAQRKIILDFAPVRFLSSAMLGVLVALMKKSRAIKGRVILCGIRPELQKIFKITSLDKIMEFAEDEAGAMRALDVAV